MILLAVAFLSCGAASIIFVFDSEYRYDSTVTRGRRV